MEQKNENTKPLKRTATEIIDTNDVMTPSPKKRRLTVCHLFVNACILFDMILYSYKVIQR